MFVAACALALCGMVASPAMAGTAEIGKPAPKFTLPDVYGNDVSLDQFKGKIVVIEWVCHTCPVSNGSHDKKQMQDTYKKYAGQGVVWLAIDSSYSTDGEANRQYAAKMGLAYPILHDPDGKVGKAYDAKTTPHMFVIDKTGLLAYDGAIDDQADLNYVDAALAALTTGKTVEKSKTKPYGCGVKYKK
jgi:peroxiredoxin